MRQGARVGKPWENGGLIVFYWGLPSGNLSHNYGKSPRLVRKLTISMAIFNSHVKHQRVDISMRFDPEEQGFQWDCLLNIAE